MHCISTSYSLSSQSIWEYWCPPSRCWNSPVGYLPIPFIFGQLFSWVSSKGKGELNSEIHFIQGGNRAQRPGREEWVSLCAVPWYVQSWFVIDEVPEKLTTCIFSHFGGMTAQKSSRRVCPNSPNAVTWWRNMFVQEAVWTELHMLQHHVEATAVPLCLEGKPVVSLMPCWQSCEAAQDSFCELFEQVSKLKQQAGSKPMLGGSLVTIVFL